MRLNPFGKRKPSVAVVRLEGVISASARHQPSMLNDTGMAPLIEKAFRKGKPKAVALVVNSPGGSPVQSSLIGNRIRRLADKHQIPVYAFVEDLAVSGGYWIASSADEIHADPCSIIGSIGVISSSFGFHEALSKIGIERRVHTAGEEKSILDPFLPENPKDVERLRELQDFMHRKFIDQVQARRGGKLDGEDLFTGRFWSGEDAVSLGLIDGTATLDNKMRELFGEDIRFRRYSRKRPFPFSIGSHFAESVADLLEERYMRSRFGL